MQIRRDPMDAAFETERLQKRMDSLSFRLTLALLMLCGLIAVLSFAGYSHLNTRLAALRQAEDALSPRHPVQQKLFALSARSEEISQQLSLQGAGLEQIKKSLEKANGLQQGGVDSLTRSLQDFETRLARLEGLPLRDDGNLEKFSEELRMTRQALEDAAETRKKLAAELGVLKKENTQLKEHQNRQKGLLDGLQKDLQALTRNLQDDQAVLRKLQAQQEKLKTEMEKWPKDTVQKTDLDTLIRRLDNARTALENRMQQKFQQIQVSLDAAIRAAVPPLDTQIRPPAPVPPPQVEQETLQN